MPSPKDQRVSPDLAGLQDLPGVRSVRMEDGHICLRVTEPHVVLPALLDRLRADRAELAEPDHAPRQPGRRLRPAHRPAPARRGGAHAHEPKRITLRRSRTAYADYWPLGQLILARLREFIREPEAVFWVYGFPILMTVALGIAFRNKPAELHPRGRCARRRSASPLVKRRSGQKRAVQDPRSQRRGLCRQRLRTGKVELVVVPPEIVESEQPVTSISSTPGRAESRLARDEVDGALSDRPAARPRPRSQDETLSRSRAAATSISWCPGLLGMGLMGGGLWGVGFVTVDMRIRKLLKRFLATPMRKSDFLAGADAQPAAVHGAGSADPVGVRALGLRRDDRRQVCWRSSC